MTEKYKPNVCVVGLGYIGLPTAAILASRGIKVVGVDVKPEVIDTINKGEIHIVEPELEAVTSHAVQQGYLSASSTPCEADVFLVAVPTPFVNGRAELSYVRDACHSIAHWLRKGNIVIVESTCPPGTTEKVCSTLQALRSDLRFPMSGGGDHDIFVAYCPERVLPGRVLAELVENNRVIGGITSQCATRAQQFYSIFCKGALTLTDARTAEMCKLTENSFRDVNIAFANELSLVCDRLGVDVWELIRLANGHPRVSVLQPGPGVGGHCIAVDPWFIVEAAPDEAKLIRTARQVNDSKPAFILQKIRQAIDDARADGCRPKVACLGLAFKADVDDLRESPAMLITKEVARFGDCDVLVCEPNIDKLPSELSDIMNVSGIDDVEETICRGDIIVLLVDHSRFHGIAGSTLIGKRVIDTRGVLSRGRGA